MAKKINLDNVTFTTDGTSVQFKGSTSGIYWDYSEGQTYDEGETLGHTVRGQYGTFTAINEAAKTYSYTTNQGGEYTVEESKVESDVTKPNAYIVTFDASKATSKVTFDGTENTKLTEVLTGSGKDAISVGASDEDITVSVNAGAGNDTVTVTEGKAVLTGGAGKDTFVVGSAEGEDGKARRCLRTENRPGRTQPEALCRGRCGRCDLRRQGSN